MKVGIFVEIDDELVIQRLGVNYPIYDRDLDRIKTYAILPGDSVEFELIDEFTHPEFFEHVGWGDGVTCAKLNLEDYD
jgi:hypothetical protein